MFSQNRGPKEAKKPLLFFTMWSFDTSRDFFIGIVLSKKTDVLCNMMKDRHSSSVDLSFLLALHNIEILYLPKSEWSSKVF